MKGYKCLSYKYNSEIIVLIVNHNHKRLLAKFAEQNGNAHIYEYIYIYNKNSNYRRDNQINKQ